MNHTAKSTNVKLLVVKSVSENVRKFISLLCKQITILMNFNFTKKASIHVKSPTRSLAKKPTEKVNRLQVSIVKQSYAKPVDYHKQSF